MQWYICLKQEINTDVSFFFFSPFFFPSQTRCSVVLQGSLNSSGVEVDAAGGGGGGFEEGGKRREAPEPH